MPTSPPFASPFKSPFASSFIPPWEDSASVTYLLNATYTSGKTAEDGTITYTETDGSIAASGGVADVTAQSTAAWGDLGWVSQDTNSAAGYGFLFTLNGSAIATTQLLAGWATNGIATTNMMNAVYVDGSGNVDTYVNGSAGPAGIGTVTNSQNEKFAIVKGGYDASGVPMDASANIASYAYGASIFKYIGSAWTLLYRTSSVVNTGQDYAAMSFYDYGGTYDDPRIPDADLSSVLLPTVLDTFTDTNGTALASHTKDVGGAWTDQIAGWEIQSNKAQSSTALSISTVDSGLSDCFVESTMSVALTTSGFHTLLRFSDTSNYWFVNGSASQDRIQVYEVNGGTTTLRAFTSVTINAATDYRLTAMCEGQTITGWLDDSATVTYSSAALNETATVHGVRHSNNTVAQTVENFAIYPRSGYTDLDSY